MTIIANPDHLAGILNPKSTSSGIITTNAINRLIQNVLLLKIDFSIINYL